MSKKKKKDQAPAAAEEIEKVSAAEDEAGEAASEESESADASDHDEESHGEEAHGHGDHHDPLEEDRPRNGLIALITVVTCVVVVGMVIGVREVFNHWGNALVKERVLSVQSTQLRELRASEQQRLGHYQWASKQEGVVRIPVDRAIELTIASYRAPLPPPTVKEEPSPAPKPEDVKPEEKKGEDGKPEEKKGEPGKKDEKKDEAPKEPRK